MSSSNENRETTREEIFSFRFSLRWSMCILFLLRLYIEVIVCEKWLPLSTFSQSNHQHEARENEELSVKVKC